MHNLWLSLVFLNEAVSEKPFTFLAAFAPLVALIQSQVTDIANILVVSVITGFWLIDLCLGTVRAIIEKRFEPKRFMFGVARWLFWMLVIFVAIAIKVSIPVVGGVICTIITSVVILAEASSILRHLALLSGEERIKRILNMYANILDDKIDDIVPGEENDLKGKENANNF